MKPIHRSSLLASAAAGPLFVLAACSSSDAPKPVVPAFGLTERVPVEGLAFPPIQYLPTDLSDDRAFPLVFFPQVLQVAAPPDGSGRLVAVMKGGTVDIFTPDPDLTAPDLTRFLDLSARVETTAECGLLGLAFHPEFATNGLVYVHYVSIADEGGPRRSVISRFTVGADPDVLDPASEEVLLEVEKLSFFHAGGTVAFGPDGMLYASIGDDIQYNEAQSLENLYGTVVRLTPDGDIPADNPFVDVPGARGEIWAYGFRNPWRFSFDPPTGDLWLGDVGEDDMEEINVVVPGGNYGWPIFEGTLENLNPGGLPFADFEAPVFTYTHPEGQARAVTGGFVYRGHAMPSLRGAYVFADFITGDVTALLWDGEQVTYSAVVAATGVNISSFGLDADGELLACDLGGHVLRFEEAQPPETPVLPQLLSETGIFADLATLEPAPGLIPYEVISPLWSDGAAKLRWIALPGTSQIQFSPDGNWTFPDGSVFVKHFSLETVAEEDLRLETRVMWLENRAWQAITYRWNEEQTDAVLLSGQETLEVTVPTADGPLTFDWVFPSPASCFDCHTAPAGRALGVSTQQLNRTFPYPTVQDNQIRAWNNIGLFSEDVWPSGTPDWFTLVDPADPTAPLSGRARSYLLANCAHCHMPDTQYFNLFGIDMDARANIHLSEAGMIDADPLYVPPGLGLSGQAKRVTPFDKEDSVLYARMLDLGFFRMPWIGSKRLDPLGLEVIGDWIDAGAPE